jgi:predicted 2-oxoglutarate/Fe(II)-dependent dioxygenase YbiX
LSEYGVAATIGAELRANPHIVDVAISPLFTPAECDEILAACDDQAWEDDPPSSARSAPRRKTEQLLPGGNNGAFGERVAARVAEVNREVFGFRVVGLEDGVRLSAYDAEVGGRFGPHGDLSVNRSLRKLTFSVLLSDPDAFEGGDLAFLTGPLAEARVQGALALFPFFLMHQVTPVTSGRRVTIVGWAIGPTFV